MKITNYIERDFTPVKIAIELETKEEFDILLTIFAANVTIPEYIKNCSPYSSVQKAYTMIGELADALRKTLDSR